MDLEHRKDPNEPIGSIEVKGYRSQGSARPKVGSLVQDANQRVHVHVYGRVVKHRDRSKLPNLRRGMYYRSKQGSLSLACARENAWNQWSSTYLALCHWKTGYGYDAAEMKDIHKEENVMGLMLRLNGSMSVKYKVKSRPIHLLQG